MAFETTNLKPLLDRAGLKCPPVNQKALASLMTYAMERDFGLSLRPTNAIQSFQQVAIFDKRTGQMQERR